MAEKEFLLEEEKLLVRNSGEIPEVALHGSLYYLTADPEGPGVELGPGDVAALGEQVIARYLEIIHRDLDPGNRDKSIYRGLARAAVNWQRLARFCRKANRDEGEFRAECAAALRGFLTREAADVRAGHRRSCINCPAETLAELAAALGLVPAELPAGWQDFCLW
ncbi:MAG: hypothetical protein M0017_01945 [Desulfobacteraceae bacterium]|nr:hypothetical protein [Desulfobacteraceae bacterium]